MRKKWFVMTLVLLVAVSFVLLGCGEKKRPAEGGDTTTQTTETAPTDAAATSAPAATEEAAPAADAGTK